MLICLCMSLLCELSRPDFRKLHLGVKHACMLVYTSAVNPWSTVLCSGKGWGGMDWIHLAQDTEQWPGSVNTVIDLRVL
jgi:hypothetical protein